ncbi:MAG: PF20097 family protein [Erysipelotrichales bacterium]|nr:PF20097 family protein [Erysipelotrichales bacterium]
MKIDKCPYCGEQMQNGKLYFINNLRTPKIVLESNKEIKIRKRNFDNHIKDVSYCEYCKIYLGKTLE